jgi:MFS family permease
LGRTQLYWPSTFAALQHRNYRLWFFGQMASLMGTWMQSVAQGWLVYMLTGSEFALGTVSFVGTIPTLFLTLPAGAVADRVSRRGLLLVTQAVMMGLAFILAFLAATGTLRVWHIGLLAFGLGIATSFDAPARQALVVEIVEDRRDMMNAIALNSTMFNMARIVGPAIGGVVLASLGPVWCFALNGLSFLAIILGLLWMRLPQVQRASPDEPFAVQIMAGLGYIRQNVPVRTMIALVGVTSLFGFFYATLLPAYAVDVLQVGETGLGALNAAVGLGALVGSLIVASLGSFRHKGLLLTAGSLLFPTAVLLFAFSRSFLLSLGCLVVIGLAFVTQNATINTLIQSVVPDSLRGRVMAVFSLAFLGTAPFAALQAGVLAQALGPGMGVAIGAGIALAFGLGVLFTVPTLRRLEG